MREQIYGEDLDLFETKTTECSCGAIAKRIGANWDEELYKCSKCKLEFMQGR